MITETRTFDQFCQDANKYYLSVKPQQRYGQALVNYLREVNYDLYIQVPADVDPWDNDKLVNSFLYWLSERWS